MTGHSPSQTLQFHVTVTERPLNVCSGRTVPSALQNVQRSGTRSRSTAAAYLLASEGLNPPDSCGDVPDFEHRSQPFHDP